MIKRAMCTLLATIGTLIVCSGCVSSEEPVWSSATPEESGLRSEKLAVLVEDLNAKHPGLDSYLLLRGDKLVLSVFREPSAPHIRHDVASITKTFTALGVLISEGTHEAVELDQPFSAQDDLTLRGLLSMQSALACGSRPGEPELEEMRRSENWADFVTSLPRRDLNDWPFAYCSPGIHLASAEVSNKTGQPLSGILDDHVFKQLGIKNWSWPSTSKVSHGWGDLELPAFALLKVGILIRDGGVYNGKQVIPASLIEELTRPHVRVSSSEAYGLSVWLPDSPEGIVQARGRGGQRLIVWPSQDIVIVTLGSGFDFEATAGTLVAAISEQQSLPANDEGYAKLQAAIDAMTPSLEASSAANASTNATQLFGNTYVLSENSVGIQSIRLVHLGEEGRLRIVASDRVIEAPFSWSGSPVVSEDENDGGSQIAASAEWVSTNRIVVNVRHFGLASHFVFEISVVDGITYVSARDLAGSFEIVDVPAHLEVQ